MIYLLGPYFFFPPLGLCSMAAFALCLTSSLSCPASGAGAFCPSRCVPRSVAGTTP